MIKDRQKYWFMKVAWTWLHKPYKWGGDDPIEGVDCSGLVVDCLQACGIMRPHDDETSASLWDRFKNKSISYPDEGHLAFWTNKKGKIIHVAICMDKFACLTADGGGSSTLDYEDAQAQNAFIKIRPILHRKNPPVGYINLF